MLFRSENIEGVPQQSKNKLTISSEFKGHKSRLLLIESPLANANYNETEEVPLLLLDSAMTPNAIYALAGNIAVQIDQRATLTQVPISIRDINSQSPNSPWKLTFQGVENFDYPLYLIDNVKAESHLLSENSVIELEYPNQEQWRYFINNAPLVLDENKETESSIVCYNYSQGQVMVVSNKRLHNIKVLDPTGRWITSYNNIDQYQQLLNLPQGAYLLIIDCSNEQRVESVIVK